jgi:hypothetical protein
MGRKVDPGVATLDATIRSEQLEPVAQYLIGRWFVKVEQAKLSDGPDKDYKVEHAWVNFWHGLHGLQSVGVACEEAVHFGLVISNMIVRVAGMIQDELGVDVFNDPMWKH